MGFDRSDYGARIWPCPHAIHMRSRGLVAHDHRVCTEDVDNFVKKWAGLATKAAKPEAPVFLMKKQAMQKALKSKVWCWLSLFERLDVVRGSRHAICGHFSLRSPDV
jgi:hypothetical protein